MSESEKHYYFQCFWRCIGVSKGLVILMSLIYKKTLYRNHFSQISNTGAFAQDDTIRLMEETTMDSPDNFKKRNASSRFVQLKQFGNFNNCILGYVT